MAIFLVRKTRCAKVAKELLGATFAGILVSDRWSAYSWVDVLRRQLCWAHLLRQFLGFQDHGPEDTVIGKSLELLTETMFHLWHRVRDGTLSRADFQELMASQTMTSASLAKEMRGWASRVKLQKLKRHPRGPKKPVPKRTQHVDSPQVSTARLLAESRRK